jgi:cbb3-type cytochrome oxidase maturation protein
MTVIYILLPIALFLSFSFLAAFIIMSSQGQYEDLDTPAYRLLIDDEVQKQKIHGRKSICHRTKT